MNHKRAVPVPQTQRPVFLHEIRVNGHRLVKGMLVSVHRRPNLPGGRYMFGYAEPLADGTLLIHVEGPISREPWHKVIRQADIKTVHVKSA